MKTKLLALILIFTGLGLRAQPVDAPIAPTLPAASASGEEIIPAGNINFQGSDVNQVLEIYAQLVGRTLLYGQKPAASITLKTETPLTKAEAIEALQAVLGMNNIVLENIGDKFVKVLPADQAGSGGQDFNAEAEASLPPVGGYVTRIVQLKYVKPSEIMPALTPFAKLNSMVPLDSNGILIIRDYAENVKRMLEMIDQVDVSLPAVYTNEVIAIKYALADDIANVLTSLGGSGGSTVSFGSSAGTPAPVSGLAARTGTAAGRSLGVQTNPGTPGGSPVPGATPNGTPATGTPFQQRLQQIIQRASGASGDQDQIQVFGQAKIIADQRSNSLLVFASAADMERIKEVVSKLDVLLSQVLIESAIIDVQLGKTFNLGVSAAQNPKTFSPSQGISGGGGSVNGPSFLQFLGSAATNGNYSLNTNSSSIFGNILSSGLSYFGNIGPTWDVALQAAEGDNSATVIQSPRVQTSQAKAATFFVGQTVPYVTGTSYGGAYGNQNNYSQLSVGVELDVTPFINPDGLVVMDINQEIDDISGSTVIQGVGSIPNTDKRTLSSEIAVKDRDTIMLGGFVRSDKSTSKAGVPFLQDIPLLGNLFTQRNDSKNRTETVVLIRPTVLRTPELADLQAMKEEQRLPGIAHAIADDAADTQKQIDAERKTELRSASRGGHDAGIFGTQLQDQTVVTNPVPMTDNVPGVTNTVPTVVPTVVATNGVPKKAAAVPEKTKPVEQPDPAAGLF